MKKELFRLFSLFLQLFNSQVLANTDALIGADFFNFESMKSKSLAAACQELAHPAPAT